MQMSCFNRFASLRRVTHWWPMPPYSQFHLVILVILVILAVWINLVTWTILVILGILGVSPILVNFGWIWQLSSFGDFGDFW